MTAPAATGRLASSAVLATCLVACGAYAGAIRVSALTGLLLPAVVVGGLVVGAVGRHWVKGLVATAACSVGLGELVNAISGVTNGPVARSTFSAVAGTGLAMLLARTRRPTSFLIGVLVIFVGALVLGAGGKVTLVALGTAGMAQLAIVLLERQHRRLLHRDRPVVPVVLALVLVALVSFETATLQADHDSRPAAAPLRKILTQSVDGPPVLRIAGHAKPIPAPSSTIPTPAPSPTALAESRRHERVSRWWLWLLLLLVLPLLVLARLLLAEVLWRRRARRIVKQNPSPAVAAWLWTGLQLQRYGRSLPASLSPDRVPADHPLTALGAAATQAAFAPPLAVAEDGADLWEQARAATRIAWAGMPRHHRWAARWRLP